MHHPSTYPRIIRRAADALGAPLEDGDARRVEAFMRTRFGTLDSLTPADFRAEVRRYLLVLRDSGDAAGLRHEYDRLADSYGLHPEQEER